MQNLNAELKCSQGSLQLMLAEEDKNNYPISNTGLRAVAKGSGQSEKHFSRTSS